MSARNRKRGITGVISALIVIMVTLMAVSLALIYMNKTVQVSNKKAQVSSDSFTLQTILHSGEVRSFYSYNKTTGILSGWIYYNVPEPVKLDYVEAIVYTETGNSQSPSMPIAIINKTRLVLAGRGLIRVLDINLTRYMGNFIPADVNVSTFKVGISFNRATTSMVMNSTKTYGIPLGYLGNNGSPGNGRTGSSGGTSGSSNNSGGAGNAGPSIYNIYYNSTDREIRLSGNFSFVVTGGEALVNQYTITRGDIVTLEFNSTSSDGGYGYLSVDKDGKVKFEFYRTNVTLFLNGNEIGSASEQDLSISGITLDMNNINSTLTFEVEPQPAGNTTLISNGTLVISHKEKDATHITIKYIEPGGEGLYVNIYGDRQYISNYERNGSTVAKYITLEFEENAFPNECNNSGRYFEIKLEPLNDDDNRLPSEMQLHSEIWGISKSKMIISGTSGGIPIKIVLDLSKQCPSKDGSFDAIVNSSHINSSLAILVSNENSGETELNTYCNVLEVDNNTIVRQDTKLCGCCSYDNDNGNESILLTNVTANPLYGLKIKLFDDDEFKLTSQDEDYGARIGMVYINGHICDKCNTNISGSQFEVYKFRSADLETEDRVWFVNGVMSFVLDRDTYLMSVVLHKGFVVEYVFDFEAVPQED